MGRANNDCGIVARQSLRQVKAFVKTQLQLLRTCTKTGEVADAICRLKHCVEAIDASKKTQEVSAPRNKTQDGGVVEFKFPIGIVAQVAIPEVFRRGRVNRTDFEYLRSAQAMRDFVCRKVEFLRPYEKGDKKERLDANGVDRYYFPGPIIEYEGRKFYLTKELVNRCGKFKRLLDWIYEHGISEEELLSMCAAFGTGKKKRDDQCKKISVSPGEDLDLFGNPVGSKPRRIGAYVKDFFCRLSSSGYELPNDVALKCLEQKWSVSRLGLWCPLFMTEADASKNPKRAKRYWKKPFRFGTKRYYVNSQWYVGERGQKRQFDEWAAEVAKLAGIEFSPYELEGDSNKVRRGVREKDEVGYKAGETDEVTIKVTSMKKRTFRFKG